MSAKAIELAARVDPQFLVVLFGTCRMKISRLAFLSGACAALVSLVSGPAAWAQADYPSKPVKIIVPFPAGGTSDVMGRMVADELSKILKQPFVVENVGGAGGVIGTERGAKSAPDGRRPPSASWRATPVA